MKAAFGIDPMLMVLSGASFEAENRINFSLTRIFGSARCAGGDRLAVPLDRNSQAAFLVLVAAGLALTGAVTLMRMNQVISD